MTVIADSDIELPDADQQVSCEVCLTSVPMSEADISEAEDYVAYFCGLECYAQWRQQKQDDESS